LEAKLEVVKQHAQLQMSLCYIMSLLASTCCTFVLMVLAINVLPQHVNCLSLHVDLMDPETRYM